MTVGSLFAGIGGFDLGFQRAGFEIVWQVEKDEWCQRVLEKNFPHIERFGDIKNVGAENLKAVDVICGGFPCQPFSQAGKRGGAEDDRYLWPEMLRVIQAVQPSWVVAENVYGLTVGEMEATFDEVLSNLEESGYDTQAFIIPACGVDAPHIRQRVWIVAHAESERFGETGSDSSGRSKRFASSGSTPKNVAHTDFQSLEVGQCKPSEQAPQRVITGQGSNVANTKCSTGKQRREVRRMGWQCQSFSRDRIRTWAPEPGVGRVASGVSRRVDRIRGLGNAVVPQIPEMIANLILEVETMQMRKAA